MSRNNNLSGGLFAAQPMPLTIKETPLSAMIADYLDARAIYNDRLNCGKIRTDNGGWLTLCKTGTPDRFCILRGQIIFIEVKMFGKKAATEQRAKHDELCGHGAIVLVCDSFDCFVGKFTAIRAAIETIVRKGELYD